MEENRPPSAKLKQAKLQFFMSSPVSMTSSACGQGKKRRSSGSNCLDSPTKSGKSGKPLNIIAVDNTDSPNRKAPKIRRIAFAKTSDDNDYEVSSSSEADASKGNNGNFMDRFVRKLPQDGQQEISSTNEMFDILHRSEVPREETLSAGEDKTSKEKHLEPEESVINGQNCIVIDDDEDKEDDACKTEPVHNISNVPDSVFSINSKTNTVLPANLSESLSQEERGRKGKNAPLSYEDQADEKNTPVQDVNNGAAVVENSSEGNISFKIEEAFDDSAKDGSVLPSLNDSAKDGEIHPGLNDSATDGEIHPSLSDSATDGEIHPAINDSATDGEIHLALNDSAKDGEIHPGLNDSATDGEIHPAINDSAKDGEIHLALNDSAKDGEIHPGLNDSATDGEIHPAINDSATDGEIHLALNDSAKDGEIHPGLNDSATDGEIHPAINDSATDGEIHPGLNDSAADGEIYPALNDSAADGEVFPSECSTPKRRKGNVDSHSASTSDVIQTSPHTSAAHSEKKERKVNTAKKAEKEAQKLKRKNEMLERKRKIEEEKLEKERIKKEKKEAKDKERQEQKERLEKEKLEKEKAKEEDRKKREEDKMKREAEKKKKQAALEARQEEKRKKEEEKKQREEEKLKEEEEKRKKEEKTKQAFQSFFIKPKEVNMKPTTPKQSTGMFIPFQLKKDMHLAPTVRRDALTEDKKNSLDLTLTCNEDGMKTYLEQLKLGDVKPYKTGRILRKNPQPEEDVKVVHDSEALKKVTHLVKLLQFHTDYRPPYYGTWRRRPALSARNPWKKDESVFDYEVDSDEEWEEEEPGESLSCSDGEEEKGEDVDEDDDDGWMVPHGYLSEDEGCNEDDEITPEKLKLQQLAKAKAWEEGQKRKLQAAPTIVVGCFFEHVPSDTMTGDVRLLYDFKAVLLASSTPIQTSLYGCHEPEKMEETSNEGAVTAQTPKRFQKKTVPDEAMPDLIRLVHGNTCGIKRLIREFRVYWLTKNNPTAIADGESPRKTEGLEDSFAEKDTDISCLNDSMNESCCLAESNEQMGEKGSDAKDDKDRVEDDGNGCSISKRQLVLKITSMAIREKRPGFNKICWYVHENILSQFNMCDIKLPNTWVHLLPGPAKSPVAASGKVGESPANKLAKSPFPGKSKGKSPGLRKTKVVESQASGSNKLAEMMVSSKMASKTNIEVSAVLTDDVTDHQDAPKKLTPKEQRSIKDFTLFKADSVKKLEHKFIDVKENSETVQESPKVLKKTINQKSIIDFANKRSSKNTNHEKPQVQRLKKAEVIVITSDDSCDEKSQAECDKDILSQNAPATSSEDEPMEVDIRSTDCSHAESREESQRGSTETNP